MFNTTPRSLLGMALVAFAMLAAPLAAAQTVEKTVSSIYDNRALWTIAKTANASDVTLACGQTFDVEYTVTVRKVAQILEQFPEGNITITNTTGGPVSLNDVDDIVGATSNPAIQVPLDVVCPVTFPHIMAPGEVVVCTYSGRIHEPTNTQVHNLNEAIASFGGGTVTSGQIPFNSFPDGDPQNDACIEVSDDLEGPLGTVCFDAGIEHVFNYTGTIGPFNTTGIHTVINTASFFGQDSGPGGAPDPNPNPSGGSATGEASWTVNADVECETGGCTLTQGYWKTHSEFGPAPYDATWAELPSGASTLFLNTTVTWYQLFWTPPAGGNGYIQLAHQWMAATLNVLAGADAPAGGILGTAQTLMENNPTCRTNWAGCPNGVKTQMRNLASTLDQYNNGTLPGGPEHCDGEAAGSANALVGDGETFALGAPAPNPTNGSSSIRFDVPEGSTVLMVVYDLTGREVARLADDYYEVGTHEVIFEGGNLPAGTYIVRMSAGDFHDHTRVVLTR